MVPYFALPPLTLLTDHVTAVFVSPVTVAVYWTVPLTPTVVYPGLMVIDCARRAAGTNIAAAQTKNPAVVVFKIDPFKVDPPSERYCSVLTLIGIATGHS